MSSAASIGEECKSQVSRRTGDGVAAVLYVLVWVHIIGTVRACTKMAIHVTISQACDDHERERMKRFPHVFRLTRNSSWHVIRQGEGTRWCKTCGSGLHHVCISVIVFRCT